MAIYHQSIQERIKFQSFLTDYYEKALEEGWKIQQFEHGHNRDAENSLKPVSIVWC